MPPLFRKNVPSRHISILQTAVLLLVLVPSDYVHGCLFNLLIILHIYIFTVCLYRLRPQFLLHVCMQPSFRSIYGLLLRLVTKLWQAFFRENRESFGTALHGKKQNCYHSYHSDGVWWHVSSDFYCSERVLGIDFSMCVSLSLSLCSTCIL